MLVPSRAAGGPAARSRLRAAARLQLAAVYGDALAHSDQAVAGAGTVTGTGAVVRDLELEVIGSVTKKDSGARRTGVPEGIGQRLLHDPVRGEVDARREFPRLHLRRRLRPAARPLCTCSTSLSSSFRLGCGASGRHLVASAEHAEQATHLVERLVAGPFDGRTRHGRQRGRILEHAPAATCLEDHDADRVRDHVVELTLI